MSLAVVVAVVVAGGVGAVLRYATALFVAPRQHDGAVPTAVLLVNVVASLIAGFAAGAASVGVLSPDLELVIVTGFAGGLSTFSTFGVETVELARASRWRAALFSVLANVAIGLFAAAVGVVLGRLV